ncbi:MAG: delta-aminolevulinic acid dehydratase [Eggerthellaceae bacterium]|nr:delta-aminolevulinic acid dehydratase [Eggerthellaceae bacterium]
MPAEELDEPKRIKISSKRQITIPATTYEKYGFAEYAYLEETEEGLFISPLNLASEDEELTEQLLRYLIDKGYEGEGLIARYKEIKPMFFSIHKAVKRSEEDIAAGRVRPAKEVQEELRMQYGL